MCRSEQMSGVPVLPRPCAEDKVPVPSMTRYKVRVIKYLTKLMARTGLF